MILDKGAKNCIFLGANSDLGRMFISLCRQKDLEVFALCRSEDECNSLKTDLKLNRALCYESGDFNDKFCSMLDELKSTILIDCVGGEIFGRIFSLMPECSEMILMGNLSNEDLKLSTTEFFLNNKRIIGFNILRYASEELSDDRRKEFFKWIQDDINSGGKIFGAKIAREMNLDEWNKAIE